MNLSTLFTPPISIKDKTMQLLFFFLGLEYLVAGHEDVRTGKLVVNMKSFVQRWKPSLGRKVMDILKRECKQQ